MPKIDNLISPVKNKNSAKKMKSQTICLKLSLSAYVVVSSTGLHSVMRLLDYRSQSSLHPVANKLSERSSSITGCETGVKRDYRKPN